MKLPHVPETAPADVPPPMSRRTLLQRYEIPIAHLDFTYVRECHDAKEVERMLRVLRSGEEGFFPDLQQCTERRLRELRPESKLLREEVPVLLADSLPASERSQLEGDMQDWTNDINEKNRALRSQGEPNHEVQIPQIRVSKSATKGDSKSPTETKTKDARIRSCDYDQWDKYDADTELTKLDLAEERNREASEAAAKRNVRVIDQVVSEADAALSQQATRMNAVERDLCANRLRVQGNEHYNARDYTEAVTEYTRSLAVQKSAVVLANRAMAYLKLGENAKVIRDCDASLQLDGGNVKVLLRKATALVNEDKRIEAFRVYNKVLKLDPKNGVAKKSVNKLRETIGDLPPENAFRMKIEDSAPEPPKTEPNQTRAAEAPTTSKTATTTSADDFAQLIIPNHIVPSKLATMAQTMKSMNQPNARKLSPPPLGHAAVKTKPPAAPMKAPVEFKRPCPPTDRSTTTTEYKNGVIIEEL